MSERVNIAMQSWFALQDEIALGDRAIQYMVKRIANRAGIIKKVTPHVLRHTFAINCIQKSISTRALQMFLGHDRLATTEIYLNMSPEDAIREYSQGQRPQSRTLSIRYTLTYFVGRYHVPSHSQYLYYYT
jgi:integrase/recombinase XerD